MNHADISIYPVALSHEDALGEFFELLRKSGIGKFFHPHPLTIGAAQERASYSGSDEYFVAFNSAEVVGYGMLRGWDEGYDIPSLGIAIHPDYQGQGLGRLLMGHLRAIAERRGAKKIRLKVDPANKVAIELYRSLGYQFAPHNDGADLVGFLDLDS